MDNFYLELCMSTRIRGDPLDPFRAVNKPRHMQALKGEIVGAFDGYLFNALQRFALCPPIRRTPCARLLEFGIPCSIEFPQKCRITVRSQHITKPSRATPIATQNENDGSHQ